MFEKFVRLFPNRNAAVYTSMAVFFVVMVIIAFQIQSFIDSKSNTGVAGRNSNSPVSDVVSPSPAPKNMLPSTNPTPETVVDATPAPVAVPAKASKLVEAKNQMALDDLAKLKNRLNLATEQFDSLSSRFKSLLVDEDGRRIAGSTELVESYISFQEMFSDLSKEFEKTQRTVLLFQLELDEFFEQKPLSAIPTSLTSQLADCDSNVAQLARSIEGRASGLSAIVSQATSTVPQENSLQRAIADRNTRIENQAIAAATAARLELDNQKQQAVAAAEASAAEQQRQSILDEQRARVEAAKVAAQAKRDLELLEADYQRERSKIQHYLGTLFIKTTKQPGGSVNVETKESKPVSLSALKQHGLANPDVQKACSSLLRFFCYQDAGGRGRGPYPASYIGGYLRDDEMAAIRPAYDLLDKYGLLLVEKGLLSP